MSLTATQISNAKPESKQRKLFDGGGLHLVITPKGSKLWRLKYRFGGKEKTLSFGQYPHVKLARAREQREAAKTQIANGTDPGAERRAKKRARSDADTLETVAREWLAKQANKWSASSLTKHTRFLEINVFPWLGDCQLSAIEHRDLLNTLQRIEQRGAIDTAHRVKQDLGNIYRYGIATGRVKHDLTAELQGALTPQKTKHHPAITEPNAVGELLRAIEGYSGTHIVRYALQFVSLVFVRADALRGAEWPEIDFEAREWRIPAARMKMGEKHIVPLSEQAIAVLRELETLTGKGRYVFPAEGKIDRTMSENTINTALRALGYAGLQTCHGFRTTASTLLHEQGWNRDFIERQLAHAEPNSVRAAYNHAEHLPDRRRMMQEWADYLDGLKDNAVRTETVRQ